MAILGLTRTIDSAHGTKKIHGHSFKIEITFEGAVKGDFVDGIDFHEARKESDLILDKLDKVYLNDVIGRATAETIAIYIIKDLREKFPTLKAVEVWEGINQYAKIFAEEVD